MYSGKPVVCFPELFTENLLLLYLCRSVVPTWGSLVAPRGHLVMCERHLWFSNWHLVGKGKGATKHQTTPQTASHSKELSEPKCQQAQVERRRDRVSWLHTTHCVLLRPVESAVRTARGQLPVTLESGSFRPEYAPCFPSVCV